jgi:hypothetical protein
MTADSLTGSERRYGQLMMDVFDGLESDDIDAYDRERIRVEYGDGSKRYAMTQEDVEEGAGQLVEDLEEWSDADPWTVPKGVGSFIKAYEDREELPTEDELEDWQDPIEDMRVALTSTTGFSHPEYVDDSKYDEWVEEGRASFLAYPDETDEFDGYEDWHDQVLRNLELMEYEEPEQLLTDIANLPYDEPVHDPPAKGLVDRVRDLI